MVVLCHPIYLTLYFSCVLVWDTRPPKGPQQPTTKKESEGPKNPMGVPDTFKHLDLSWKPMLKVNILHKTENEKKLQILNWYICQ